MSTTTRALCCILLLLMSSSLYGKKKKIYLDYKQNKCGSVDAAYYKVYLPTDSGYKIMEYYADTDLLYSSGFCTSVKPELKQGLYTYYYKDGHTAGEGMFLNNHSSGEWKYYFDSSRKLRLSVHFQNDSLIGSSTSYYESGNMNEIGQYANGVVAGTWITYFDSSTQPHEVMTIVPNKYEARIITYYKNGRVKQTDTSVPNKPIYGTRYDTSGHEIAYKQLKVLPHPAYSLDSFFQKNIHYPAKARKRNISGRVIVEFEVNTDGTISDVVVRKKLSDGCSEEAYRVIASMPPWQPGYYDDEPEKTLFSQPVTFSLQ